MDTQIRHDRWRSTLDLPAELRQPLVELARSNERSTSAEIRYALREHIERNQGRDLEHAGNGEASER